MGGRWSLVQIQSPRPFFLGRLGRHVLAFLGYLIADGLVRTMPAPLADRLAVTLARIVFGLRPRARAVQEANLARLRPRIAPATRRRLARRAFEHFALSLVDFLRLRYRPATGLEDRVAVRGAHHLEAARSAGRGVIVLSAHLGNWERGAAFLAASGTPVHVLARRHAHPWVERLFESRRRPRGVRTIARRPAWVPAAALLRSGGWVALMGDRGAPGATGPA